MFNWFPIKKLQIHGFFRAGMFISVLFLFMVVSGCENKGRSLRKSTDVKTTSKDTLNPGIPDNYQDIASFKYHKEWGTHNVHDPSCIKVGDWYYLYSTDVAYGWGNLKRVGIQVRKSKDLIHWQFVGWAFDGIPPKAYRYVVKVNNGKKPRNMWAPYIMKVGNLFRLYYVVSVFGSNASYIGLATSKSPDGPWKQEGAVVETTHADEMNAIDPTVAIDHNNGQFWMLYGSYFDGIYAVRLNPKTGLTLKPHDKGRLVARRNGQNFGKHHAYIEGPEVIYNPKLKKYYLFLSYGPLMTTYNIRVGRADKPEGPYKDYFGHYLTAPTDNFPIIIHPYKFDHHPGWNGTGHCAMLRVGDKYFILHQGRLAPDNRMMDLHVRKILWTKSGWPVASPERFDNVPQTPISSKEVLGEWENIVLNPDKAVDYSQHIRLSANGTVDGFPGYKTWSMSGDTLKFTSNSGQTMVSLQMMRAWDWENHIRTIAYTGLNKDGVGIWGKHIHN